LHAGLFADVGYDANVFYGPSQGQKAAPVLHIMPKLEISNAERDGTIPSGTHYVLFATLDWRKYLDSDTTITQQDALNPSVGGTVHFLPKQALGFTLGDTFTRSQQAPFSAGEPITRNYNMAAANVRYSPGGGRMTLNLRYTNLIDKYEGIYDSGSNMTNEVMLDGGWRLLPKTTLYTQVAQGVVTYFNSGHVTSYPLRTSAGLRGLVTEKLTVNLGAGYSNAFYASGDGPSGFGNVGLTAELNYIVNVLSRAGLGYRHDFANSPFVGRYYNVDAVYGAFQQMIANRFVAYLFGRYENRRFGANTQRTDNYFAGGVSLDYAVVGRYLLLGASYSINVNRSTGGGATAAGIDYTKQVLLLRLGVVY
jgi:hypothetical protein